MVEFYMVQHGDKERGAGDPSLTPIGVERARQTGAHLRTQAIGRVVSSPLRRARETAEVIGGQLGLGVEIDERLRERMNWGDGPVAQTLEDFLREWTRATLDRDFKPASGDSSRAAGRRFQSLLEDLAERWDERGGRVLLVTHGCLTVDLLRNLFGDNYVRTRGAGVLDRGVPPCAITHLIRHSGAERPYELRVLASVAHLG